jgi:hypothetical protein
MCSICAFYISAVTVYLHASIVTDSHIILNILEDKDSYADTNLWPHKFFNLLLWNNILWCALTYLGKESHGTLF